MKRFCHLSQLVITVDNDLEKPFGFGESGQEVGEHRQSWPDKASIMVKQCCSTSEKKFHFLDKPWNPLFSELIFIYIIPRKFFSAGVHFISSNLFLLLCILSPPIFGLFSLLSLVFSSLLIKQTREDRAACDFAKLSNTRVPWQSKMKENLFQPKKSLEKLSKPGISSQAR